MIAHGDNGPPIRFDPRVNWFGPAIFALAVFVYTLAMSFEASMATWNDLFRGVGSEPALDIVPLVFEWRAMVLLMIASGTGALLMACWSIYVGVWLDRRRNLMPIAALAILVLVLGLVYYVSFSQSLSVMARLSAGVHGGLPNGVKIAAELIAVVIAIGAAALVVLPASLSPADLRRRVHAFRFLLYSAALLLAVAVMAIHAALSWLTSSMSNSDSIALAGSMLSGAMYTLMLVSVFLPSGVVLEWAGRRIAAASKGEESSAEQWLEQHGLHVGWQGQAARALALLAPVLSSGVAQALSAFTGS